MTPRSGPGVAPALADRLRPGQIPDPYHPVLTASHQPFAVRGPLTAAGTKTTRPQTGPREAATPLDSPATTQAARVCDRSQVIPEGRRTAAP